MFAVPREQVVRVHASSGTTAGPAPSRHVTAGVLPPASIERSVGKMRRDVDQRPH